MQTRVLRKSYGIATQIETLGTGPAKPRRVDLEEQAGYIGYAGWSSPVARWAHNPKVVGSNPTPATNQISGLEKISKSDSLPLTPNKKITTYQVTLKPSQEASVPW